MPHFKKWSKHTSWHFKSTIFYFCVCLYSMYVYMLVCMPWLSCGDPSTTSSSIAWCLSCGLLLCVPYADLPASSEGLSCPCLSICHLSAEITDNMLPCLTWHDFWRTKIMALYLSSKDRNFCYQSCSAKHASELNWQI